MGSGAALHNETFNQKLKKKKSDKLQKSSGRKALEVI